MKSSGTPISGYVQLTNAAPGPTNFALSQISNGSAYTLQANEVFVITNMSVSSNDTANPLVTVDDGITGAPYTARTLGKYYAGATLPATLENIPLGVGVTRRGVVPRATAPSITAGKTVELVARGYITRST